MSLFQITLPKSFTKQSINLIVNSNKLENTIKLIDCLVKDFGKVI